MFKVFLLPVFLVMTTPVFASGWVKDAHQYYVKVSQSQKKDVQFDSATSDSESFVQSEKSSSLYMEYGLPFSRKLQLFLLCYCAFCPVTFMLEAPSAILGVCSFILHAHLDSQHINCVYQGDINNNLVL